MFDSIDVLTISFLSYSKATMLVPTERQHDILEQLDALLPIPLVVSLI